MGWDAFAKRNGKWIAHFDEEKKTLVIDDKELEKDFRSAADEVQRVHGTADGLLQFGGLDCSDCGKALHEATGINVYSMLKKPVALNSATQNWGTIDSWDKASAKAFFDLCVKHDLTVEFSY